MIRRGNLLKELFLYSLPILLMRSETKVRLGDLKFNSTANNKIYGDSKPFAVDSDNIVCDGNHRMNKLLEEKGPDHEVEVFKYKYPQWCALLSLGIHGCSNWTKLKLKATLKEFKEYNREQTK